MAYKQCAGRGPMQKTGRGIPLNMKSPLYQTKRKDVPEGAKFGKSTTTIDESDGMTVTTTPYSKEGTRIPTTTKPQMPDADWTALVAKRKQENKGPINPPGPGPTPSGTPSTKGTKGQSGSVETRSFNFKPREIAPLGAKIPEPKLKVAKRTLPSKTRTPGRKVPTVVGKIKKGVKKVTSNLKINKVLGTSKGGFKPGCLTD